MKPLDLRCGDPIDRQINPGKTPKKFERLTIASLTGETIEAMRSDGSVFVIKLDDVRVPF